MQEGSSNAHLEQFVEVMRSIVDNNREVLLDPVGTRVVSVKVFTAPSLQS